MTTRENELARVVGSPATVSDKIRALDAAGYSRADIARALGKRYQHVRNVLEGDKARGVAEGPVPPWNAPAAPASPQALAPTPGGHVFRLLLGADGAVTLPEPARAALGARPGDVIVGRIEADRVVLMNAVASARRARDLARAAIRGGGGLADSLIEERRREATREVDA
jgi:bifunctional DNA-binding transcriptional regulator/antitoxin component of YhaV-PrlF toxin-antitoxin module